MTTDRKLIFVIVVVFVELIACIGGLVVAAIGTYCRR